MERWLLEYEGFDPSQERLRETLCTLGNGYFATRGAAEFVNAEEDRHYPGTYLAGGYNRLTTEVAGRVVTNEDLVNMPNWLCLTFRAEGGDWFRLGNVEIVTYRQELNVRVGMLTREIRFRDMQGRETTVKSRRIVHMRFHHLAAIEMTLTAHNWSGRLDVRSALDGRVVNAGVPRYRALASRHLQPVETAVASPGVIGLLMQTTQSRILVAEAARTRVYRDEAEVAGDARVHEEPPYVSEDLSLHVSEEQSIRIEKVVAIYSSRDRGISEPLSDACTTVERSSTFADLLKKHIHAWNTLWGRCDLVLSNDGRAHEILRLHIFHLLQTVSRNTVDLDVGVPARGWHGEAYRGHVFWDELFIFPFLSFRVPEITRALLLYRHRRLGEARFAARAHGHRGAMFPWQSGSNGREENQVLHLNPKSARWVPDATHLQRHVNAAIAYNVWQYYQVTSDYDFLHVFGAEMIFEITRFFASIAQYDSKLDRYEIHGVMGPDEYHSGYPGAEQPGLKNNAYTNVMVAWLADIALRTLDEIIDVRRTELREALEIDDDEISTWVDMSHKMRVVFHDDGIISQFEGYEDLQEFDWDGYRRKYGDIQRLDRILEAEGDTPNRYKLSKQPDVLMLAYLFSTEELRRIFERLGYPFDTETIPRNIDYYCPRTSHGSTLSRIVHSAISAKYGRADSWEMFFSALESDVNDLQGGTTEEGIHLGVMAGTVDLVQRCYTGIEIYDDTLRFNPRLPEELAELDFSVRFRRSWLDVTIKDGSIAIRVRKGAAGTLKIAVGDGIHYLKPGYARTFALPDRS